MNTFEINSPDAFIAARHVTISNIEKHQASFEGMLDPGVQLTGVTVTVSAGALSTITGAARTNNRRSAYWYVNAAATAEQFVATVTVTTNDGQTLKFAVTYIIG